ncbi:ABC transporter permease [Candidatus Entotheonella palauensis]|uniref:Peptide ABC transporter permease n=1 Tax=Candidatus Entotheonella gemina TaxID=1429439 RepID=W4M637_9BACT|nr:ABC transporter permease [Candidatus Entotheonella palauensis]ETX05381.1 MAG: peptide ABC transporter permease [Candidatus Entotheonella gemina]
MGVVTLALKSLFNRRLTACLTLFAIAVSVTLLLGVNRISQGAQEGFQSTLAGTDLIIGARGGRLQLLLYSVFRIGSATNNLSWESYQDLARHPDVAWTIPISLGDSHRGYSVMGTNPDYFTHFRYGRSKSLELASGRRFEDVFDTVIGAEVAKALGYREGQQIVLTHGSGEASFLEHGDKPFRVVGILKKTGTPVDRTVHISLAGIEAIHVDWQSGAPPRSGQAIAAGKVRQMQLTPTTITAFLVGLKSKIGIFAVQREVSEYREEPLMAILPGVTLQELWQMISMADKALTAISVFVVLSGLLGMLTAILTTLNERRREMAILRSVGAKPYHIFTLLVSEAGILATLGCVVGVIMLYMLLFIAQPILEREFGLFIPIHPLSVYDVTVLGVIIGCGLLMGSVPALRAYRHSLADGLTIRV